MKKDEELKILNEKIKTYEKEHAERNGKSLIQQIRSDCTRLKEDPMNDLIYYTKSCNFSKLSKEMNDPFILRAAIESISKAIEIAPTNPQYLCERATLLVKLERYDQAELDIKTLASLPKSNDLLLATHVENTINNVTEALKQYNISTTPNHSAKILVAKPGASPADGKPVYVGSTDLFATKPTAIDKKPTAMDKSTQCDEKSFQ